MPSVRSKLARPPARCRSGPLVKGDFLKRRALKLPPEARYDTLLALPTGGSLGAAIVNAMDAIERDFEPLQVSFPRTTTSSRTTSSDTHRVTFFGQEKTDTTKCDFVMANPP